MSVYVGPCPACKGRGHTVLRYAGRRPCAVCAGVGEVTIEFPAGASIADLTFSGVQRLCCKSPEGDRGSHFYASLSQRGGRWVFR